MPITTILALTELTDILSSHLSSPDLVTCLQVSSQFHHIFAPQIWRSFDDTQPFWTNQVLRLGSKNRDRVWLENVFSRYGHLIQRAILSWRTTFELCRYHCPHLQSLTVLVGANISRQEALEIYKDKIEATLQQESRSFGGLGFFGSGGFGGGIGSSGTAVHQPESATSTKVIDWENQSIEHLLWTKRLPQDRIDNDEIMACLDLIQNAKQVWRLKVVSTQASASLISMKEFEQAVSSLTHLRDVEMTLEADQLARLWSILPIVQTLNVITSYSLSQGSYSTTVAVLPSNHRTNSDQDLRLDTIHGHLKHLTLGDVPLSASQVAALIDHCPNLKSFSLPATALFGITTSELSVTPLPLCQVYTQKHFNLKSLKVYGLTFGNLDEFLIDRFPSLESLTILGYRMPGGQLCGVTREQLYGPTKLFPDLAFSDTGINNNRFENRLRELHLNRNAIEVGHFMQFLSRCTSLERLVIDPSRIVTEEVDGVQVKKNEFVLKFLKVFDYNYWSHASRLASKSKQENKLISDLLSGMPNLEIFRTSAAIDPASLQILTTVCYKHLRIIHMDSKPFSQGRQRPRDLAPGPDIVCRILSTCPLLEELKFLEGLVHVEHVLSSDPWVCFGLQKLRCQIVGVPRLTDQEQDDYDEFVEMISAMHINVTSFEKALCEKVEKSKRVQLAVYEQLCRLTELQELDLGFGNVDAGSGDEFDENDWVPFWDTLELSLETGLDRLKSLKKLKVFGYQLVDHRVGEPEKDWMKQNWPALKTVYRHVNDKRVYEDDFEE